ncbi:SAM-dependent methyltransferase [Streptomyces sp. NPDC001858]
MATHTAPAANDAALMLKAAADATNNHYDLTPEIFECFLGEHMKYTCGIYASDDSTLDEAQEAKLEFIANCLGIQGGERVLDIGVGWGALAIYLADRYDCQVLGITPSGTQASYTRERARSRGLDDRVQVQQCSVYDFKPDGAFDAVAMVGVIEHMPDHQRAVATAAGALKSGGRLYMSATCYRNDEQFTEFTPRDSSRHVQETIFGFATLRPFAKLVGAVEDAKLSLFRATDLTLHYERTIRDWLEGIANHADRIEELRPGLSAELTRYLETVNTGWGHATKHYALAAVRSRWGLPEVGR